MVSVQQLTALIEYMEFHPEVALGRLNRSKEGRSEMKRHWRECAKILNSITTDCITKTADQWRVYFNEYKSKVMKKIKNEKTELTTTGGGQSKKLHLTPLQERLYDILGRDFGDPLPGIRHNPLSHHDYVSEEDMSEVVVVNDAIAMPFVRPPSVQQELEVREDELVNEEQWHPTDTPASTSRERAADPTSGTSSRELPPVATPDPITQATPAAPRRRRRRRRSVSLQNQENEPALHQATGQLQAMEKLNAEATQELAQATHRQAAALETIGEVLRELINQGTSPRRRLKRIRVIYSSDSD